MDKKQENLNLSKTENVAVDREKVRSFASTFLKKELTESSHNNDTFSYAKEHLGKVVINHRPGEAEPNLKPESIDTMNRAELIELSSLIRVDGSNLRQIFETKLIGENGLRRLIKAYIEGEDIKKMLRKELIEHEIDFERDPAMRDIKNLKEDNQEKGKETSELDIDLLIKKAESTLDSDEPETLKQLAKKPKTKAAQAKHHLKKIDYILVSTIIFLILAVLLIILIKG